MAKITEEKARLIREIGDAAYDGDQDASLEGVTIRRRNAAAQVYSLRLGPEDVAALEAAASSAGLPPSALARRFIVERLHGLDEGSPAALAAELADLSRKVAALH